METSDEPVADTLPWRDAAGIGKVAGSVDALDRIARPYGTCTEPLPTWNSANTGGASDWYAPTPVLAYHDTPFYGTEGATSGTAAYGVGRNEGA